jgi:dephospho-CoA kinase
MFQVGVTGGIGSGKTVVCSILEALGVPVYHADREARRLMNTHPGLKEGIERLMGEGAYLESELDRRFVGERVFGDPGLLEQVNGLVHPVVREDFRHWAMEHADLPYVVEEAAILFESGAHKSFDHTVLVYAPSDLRILRVMERDGVSETEVHRRMIHQMDEEEKRTLADEVIINDGREMLLPQVIAMHQRIINRR